MTFCSGNHTRPPRGCLGGDSLAKIGESGPWTSADLCRPHSVAHNSHDPFKECVECYLRCNAAGAERYLEFYRDQASLADAVEKAAMAQSPGGKRFSHQ